MRTTEVEQWCARVIDHLERGLRVEDDRVELKRQLPAGDPLDIARRIAGHANQARADRILWIIGAVEDPHPRVSGSAPGEADAAAWWSPIEAKFDDVAPSPVFAHVTVDVGRSVLAIGFDTSRLPYVIRLPNDRPNREVPWREGTRTRSANRFDLLRLLTPVAARPRFTLLQGHAFARLERRQADPRKEEERFVGWQGSISYYIDCAESLIIPDHRSTAVFVTPSLRLDLGLTPYVGGGRWLMSGAAPPPGRVAERGDGQILLAASAAVALTIGGSTDDAMWPRLQRTRNATLELAVETAGLDPIRFVDTLRLRQRDDDMNGGGVNWDVEHAGSS